MNEREIQKILSKGEGYAVEFKEARDSLPENIFETVCAFLNRLGGDLLLGVNDDGDVIGINPSKVEHLKNQLVSLSNNPNKLDPPFVLYPQDVEISGRKIIYIRVPQSSQVHKTANFIFDRSEDGDFRVRTHEAISRIYTRKNAYFTENRIYPYLEFSDFNEKLFSKIRNLMQSHRTDHPWLSLSDRDMLSIAGFYKKDYETGKQGYTLAAALLFGKDEVIQQILPFYKTDALLRREDLDHYDDRREIRTNLIDAYDELMLFIRTHLKDKFYLEGDIRVDLREKIFREVVANMLIHREYANAAPARFIIYRNKLVTENANNPVGSGPIDPENFSPHPKNPAIMKFFQQLGRAEELGSGIRNIKQYLPLYSKNSRFELIEGDTFTAIVTFEESDATPQATMQVNMQVNMQVKQLILNCIGEVSMKQLMKALKLRNRDYFRKAYLKPAIEKGLIEMTIPDQPKNRNQKYRLTESGKKHKKILDQKWIDNAK
ncbi:putative DNA binding domain-containing protein [candidate division KSB1 bacterium]|nr:putative DNA binding domain-containing protein [candidate division KSB1 bacterium]